MTQNSIKMVANKNIQKKENKQHNNNKKPKQPQHETCGPHEKPEGVSAFRSI